MPNPTNEQTHEINALLLNLNDPNASLIEKARQCLQVMKKNDPLVIQALNKHLKTPEAKQLKKLIEFTQELDKKDQQALDKRRGAYGSDDSVFEMTESDRTRHQLIDAETEPLIKEIRELIGNEKKHNEPNSYTKLRACIVMGNNNHEIFGKLRKVAEMQSGFSLTQGDDSKRIYDAILKFQIGGPKEQEKSLETLREIRIKNDGHETEHRSPNRPK